MPLLLGVRLDVLVLHFQCGDTGVTLLNLGRIWIRCSSEGLQFCFGLYRSPLCFLKLGSYLSGCASLLLAHDLIYFLLLLWGKCDSAFCLYRWLVRHFRWFLISAH